MHPSLPPPFACIHVPTPFFCALANACALSSPGHAAVSNAMVYELRKFLTFRFANTTESWLQTLNLGPRNLRRTNGTATFSVQARSLTPETLEELMENQHFRFKPESCVECMWHECCSVAISVPGM